MTLERNDSGEISEFSENLELSLGQSSKHPNVVPYLCAFCSRQVSLHQQKVVMILYLYTFLIQSAESMNTAYEEIFSKVLSAQVYNCIGRMAAIKLIK